MPVAPVTVEPVEARTELRRFAEMPYALHHDDPRWRAGVRAWEEWRLDARRHPYFDRGDAAFLLARIGGRPAGRIAAHVAGSDAVGAGFFGFFDAPDEPAVVEALLDAAHEWLAEQGATSMTGPVSWTADEEFGVLVDGFEHPARTGAPWRPAWYAERLLAAGLVPGERRVLYRLAAESADGPAPEPADLPPPSHAGRYADRALVLDGIAAVPDVSEALAGASLRSAWRVARAARDRAFDTAVCVRCDGDPSVLVPRLRAAADAAGYRWILAPWAPDDRSPQRTYQVFSRSW